MAYSPLYFQPSGLGTARRLLTNYVNGSGATMAQCTPAYTMTSGQIDVVNVSVESTIDAMVGIVSADIASGASGPIVDAGRIENVSLSFAIGDSVYISKAGFLTNVKPDIGVGGFAVGDFVVFIGAIVKNEFNPSNKDLVLDIDVLYQL